ncbi:vitronectin [Rhinatrema bivittatum]|uniref:vitronectin n=1 Tax=Rhinatrema bivittatum TaxID=194408 RepID=UPI00112D8CCD|nr:vitronectin [Rhinatrema bivittatum]
MKLLLTGAALLSLLLSPALTDQESCEGRCDEGFNAKKKCQCDHLCNYYESCCFDYGTVCSPKVTRGDIFALPDDEYVDYNETLIPTSSSGPETEPQDIELVTTQLPFEENTELVTEIPELPTEPSDSVPEAINPQEEQEEGDEKEDLCSGKSFDAFTDLKNGSIYAFRGKYYYELDEKGVRPGFPKIIQDVWGIEGPVDAAFTRINCQGNTYIFKGSEYWRFDNGVLDPDYPRNISQGFKGIPNNVNAAFALPAQNYRGSERVYFFKGNRYWQYVFSQQPSRQDCEDESPSVVFDQFTFLNMHSFQTLYDNLKTSGSSKPRFISRDWKGLPGGVDAAVAGKIYFSQQPQKFSRRNRKWKSRRNRMRYQRRRFPSWRRFWNWQSEEDDNTDMDPDWLMTIRSQCNLLQSAYFFKKDKYYRVNLRTKRVDFVRPRYPRSIAQFWLGCTDVEKRRK